ncbi:hypothetical protein [Actinomycetospora aeridis]|uniref:Uncharacterized protein n=1 Tax=Actinomycetospora aeridis TaxID=3129231 RepID=A0ABU8N9E6_9PSEU
MDSDARVTTAVVGLLIAFCAVLLAKWLAVVALAALVLLAVLRFALRRTVRAFRARRARVSAPVPEVAAPVAARRDGSTRRGSTRRGSAGASASLSSGRTCSWCGLAGGHHDLHGQPMRPRHAHALTRS